MSKESRIKLGKNDLKSKEPREDEKELEQCE